jgi:hypothetical protein
MWQEMEQALLWRPCENRFYFSMKKASGWGEAGRLAPFCAFTPGGENPAERLSVLHCPAGGPSMARYDNRLMM